MKDDKQLLRWERWIYGVTQTLLLISILATAYFLVMIGLTAGWVENQFVFRNVDRLMLGMSREYYHRIDDIAHFPPPQNSAELRLWADSVGKHLGFPAVVFVWKDSTFNVVSAPPHLEAFAADLPRLINPQTPKGQRFKPDTLGNMVFWKAGVKADTAQHTEHSAYAFQRVGDPMAWGIIGSFNGARREMAEEILKYDPHNMLASRRWVRLTEFPEFRMFSKDTVLAASAKLDTTHSKYAEKDEGRLRFEYYLGGFDQQYVDLLKHPRLLYFLLCVEAAMVGVVFVFHRWIKRLQGIVGEG